MSISNRPITIIRGDNLESISFLYRIIIFALATALSTTAQQRTYSTNRANDSAESDHSTIPQSCSLISDVFSAAAASPHSITRKLILAYSLLPLILTIARARFIFATRLSARAHRFSRASGFSLYHSLPRFLSTTTRVNYLPAARARGLLRLILAPARAFKVSIGICIIYIMQSRAKVA